MSEAISEREDSTLPITDDGLRELERKAWRRMGPPSQTYTLRVVTLRRLIARVRAAELIAAPAEQFVRLTAENDLADRDSMDFGEDLFENERELWHALRAAVASVRTSR